LPTIKLEARCGACWLAIGMPYSYSRVQLLIRRLCDEATGLPAICCGGGFLLACALPTHLSVPSICRNRANDLRLLTHLLATVPGSAVDGNLPSCCRLRDGILVSAYPATHAEIPCDLIGFPDYTQRTDSLHAISAPAATLLLVQFPC
jgi:hypothetical protein